MGLRTLCFADELRNFVNVFGSRPTTSTDDARAVFVPFARLHSERVAGRFAEPLIVCGVIDFA